MKSKAANGYVPYFGPNLEKESLLSFEYNEANSMHVLLNNPLKKSPISNKMRKQKDSLEKAHHAN